MIELKASGFFSYSKDNNKQNQDSILPPVKIDDGYLFAVADGVGSYFGAENASESAIRYLSSAPTPKTEDEYRLLFDRIKDAVSALSLSDEALSEAATTLTFCYVDSEKIRIGHVGDCRLYLRKNGRLVQITSDHTQHQKLLEKKIYTKSELKTISVKNTLTTAISKFIPLEYQSVELDLYECSDDENEIDIFIMSDGAHDFWEKRPRFSLNTLASPNSFVASLLKRIRRSGPKDDHTCLSVKFGLSKS